MHYYLDTTYIMEKPWITLVGCGGTGGFVAESLCRLFQGRPMTLVLVDPDRIEPHNLLRQNFRREEVGQFKSEALATRLAREFNRIIGHSNLPFVPQNEMLEEPGQYPGRGPRNLVIGCADNARAREAMAEVLDGSPYCWLIDAGNDTNWGQVLIGNSHQVYHHDEDCPFFTDEICHLAPAPTLQRPDLLTATSPRPPDVDCAAALDLTDQDPTINPMMAAVVVSIVRRMAAGTCPYLGVYVDLELGTMTPNYVTPEKVNKLLVPHRPIPGPWG